jgi:hypothetical protein
MVPIATADDVGIARCEHIDAERGNPMKEHRQCEVGADRSILERDVLQKTQALQCFDLDANFVDREKSFAWAIPLVLTLVHNDIRNRDAANIDVLPNHLRNFSWCNSGQFPP